MGDQLSFDFGNGADAEEGEVSVQTTKELIRALRDVTDRLSGLEEKLTLMERRLWTIQNVADYLGTSAPTARRVLMHPGAPKPIRLLTHNECRMPPRYDAAEFIQFVKRQKGRS